MEQETSQGPPDDDPTRAVVDRLVRDLAPVRPLRSPVIRLGWWLPGALAVVGYGIIAARPDLATLLARPGFVLEIAGLAAIGVGIALLALRGAVPGLAPGRGARATGLTLLAAVVLGALARRADAGVTVRAFITGGLDCGAATMALAAAPATLLFAAAARGAAVAPGWTGAFAGGAGVVVAYLAMRLHCPLDECLHLLVGHGLPVALTVATCAAIGRRLLQRV